ncbi:hypothetical protein AVEN_97596-1, partial [Araneus ventricosus]
VPSTPKIREPELYPPFHWLLNFYPTPDWLSPYPSTVLKSDQR